MAPQPGMMGRDGKGTIGERIEQVWDLGSGAVSRRQRSGGDPTHTQNLESRSHRPRAWFVCVGVVVVVVGRIP